MLCWGPSADNWLRTVREKVGKSNLCVDVPYCAMDQFFIDVSILERNNKMIFYECIIYMHTCTSIIYILHTVSISILLPPIPFLFKIKDAGCFPRRPVTPLLDFWRSKHLLVRNDEKHSLRIESFRRTPPLGRSGYRHTAHGTECWKSHLSPSKGYRYTRQRNRVLKKSSFSFKVEYVKSTHDIYPWYQW